MVKYTFTSHIQQDQITANNETATRRRMYCAVQHPTLLPKHKKCCFYKLFSEGTAVRLRVTQTNLIKYRSGVTEHLL